MRQIPLKISLVTVTFNDFERLARTASSVLAQTSVNFEWVIIDSNSTDNSVELYKFFSFDSRLRILRSDRKGIYNAMNEGWRMSRGDYIWYLNSGDIFLRPDSIETVIKLIAQNKMGFVASPVLNFTKQGYSANITSPSLDSNNYCQMNHQGVIVKRDLINSVSGFDESLKFAADGKLLDSIARISKPFFIEDILVGFELGGTSSINFKQTLQEIATYRHQKFGVKKFILIGKNSLRIRLLNMEGGLGIFIRLIYYKRSQSSFHRSKNFVTIKSRHFPDHRISVGPVLSCCINSGDIIAHKVHQFADTNTL